MEIFLKQINWEAWNVHSLQKGKIFHQLKR